MGFVVGLVVGLVECVAVDVVVGVVVCVVGGVVGSVVVLFASLAVVGGSGVAVAVFIVVGSPLEVSRLLSIVAQEETEIRAKRKKSLITMFLLTMRFERYWTAQHRQSFLLSILITA